MTTCDEPRRCSSTTTYPFNRVSSSLDYIAIGWFRSVVCLLFPFIIISDIGWHLVVVCRVIWLFTSWESHLFWAVCFGRFHAQNLELFELYKTSIPSYVFFSHDYRYGMVILYHIFAHTWWLTDMSATKFSDVTSKCCVDFSTAVTNYKYNYVTNDGSILLSLSS